MPSEERRLRRMMRASRPVPYGPFSWWRDRRAGRKDGTHGVFRSLMEEQSPPQDFPGPEPSVTPPYVAGLEHRFGEQAARLRSWVAATVEGRVAERDACETEIRAIQRRSGEIRAELAEFPVQAPADVLARRNVLEFDKPDALIAARNQREWSARRAIPIREDAGLQERSRSLHRRIAVLDGEILAVENIGAALVRRRYEHARRRTRTYQQHLVRTDTNGVSVLAVLDFTGPVLPLWVEKFTDEAAHADKIGAETDPVPRR